MLSETAQEMIKYKKFEDICRERGETVADLSSKLENASKEIQEHKLNVVYFLKYFRDLSDTIETMTEHDKERLSEIDSLNQLLIFAIIIGRKNSMKKSNNLRIQRRG